MRGDTAPGAASGAHTIEHIAARDRRACLDEATIAAFIARTLGAARLARVESHMAGCAECRGLVSVVARNEVQPTRPQELPVVAPSRWPARWPITIAPALLLVSTMAAIAWGISSSRRASPSLISLEIADRTGYADRAWMPIAVSEQLRATLAAQGPATVLPARWMPHEGTRARVEGLLASRPDGRIRLTLDIGSGQTIVEEGKLDELTPLTERAAARLRRALALGPLDEAGESQLHASLPPGHATLRWYGEGVARARAHDPEAARTQLERAVSAAPRFAPAQLALSSVAEALGDPARAAFALEVALDGWPEDRFDEALALTAHLRELERDWPRAVALHRRLLARRPDDLAVGAQLADAERAAGLPDVAIATLTHLQRTVERREDPPLLELALARATLAARDPARARAAARAALSRAVELGLPRLASAASRLECAALARLGNTTAALASADEARTIAAAAGDSAGEAESLVARGTLLAAQGAAEQARSAFTEAAALAQAAGDIAHSRAAREALASLGPLPPTP